jgi:hypothetical protein
LTKSELEALMRELIKNGDEYDRLDLKSSYDFNLKKDRIRLVKCISAIANTDSPYFEGMGYIVLGAKRGQLVGGFDALEKDATSADIHLCVGEYVDPVVSFSIERFKDEKLGWWGVIIIPPSLDTHVMNKEFRELNIRKGDVYVRHGDSIALGDRTDVDRLQRRKFKNTVDRLESEVRTLSKRIEQQQAQKPDLKLFFLDDKKNRHESLEVQPVFWEKTEEQIKEEASNEASINRLEKELEGFKTKMLTTRNAQMTTAAVSKINEELLKQKTLRYEYQKNDPAISRIIELNFILSNDGNTLAEGISIYLYFPRSLGLSASRKALQKPEVENPQWSQMASLIPFLTTSSHVSPYYPSAPPIPDIASPKYGGPEISETGEDLYAKYWLDKLLQHHGYSLSPVYLISPEYNVDIEVPCKIYAENVPGVVQATLRLGIRPKRTKQQ